MEGSKKGTGSSSKGPRQLKKSRFYEEQSNAKEEAVSYLQKVEAEYAEYVRGRYFSGKDIFGEDIFKLTSNIGGYTLRASRLSPTKSFADPIAYIKEAAEIKKKLLIDTDEFKKKSLADNAEIKKKSLVDSSEFIKKPLPVTAEIKGKSCVDPAEFQKKSPADARNIERSRCPPPEVNVKLTGKKVCSPSMQDSDDESSDSLEELSVDAWNEVQSAMKLAKSAALPFKKRR